MMIVGKKENSNNNIQDDTHLYHPLTKWKFIFVFGFIVFFWRCIFFNCVHCMCTHFQCYLSLYLLYYLTLVKKATELKTVRLVCVYFFVFLLISLVLKKKICVCMCNDQTTEEKQRTKEEKNERHRRNESVKQIVKIEIEKCLYSHTTYLYYFRQDRNNWNEKGTENIMVEKWHVCLCVRVLFFFYPVVSVLFVRRLKLLLSFSNEPMSKTVSLTHRNQHQASENCAQHWTEN